MVEYSKIAAKIDAVANTLQELGYTKEAEHLDMVANSVEAFELEAGGFFQKLIGTVGLLAALGLTPAQAKNVSTGQQELSPQQIEILQRTDPGMAQQYLEKKQSTPSYYNRAEAERGWPKDVKGKPDSRSQFAEKERANRIQQQKAPPRRTLGDLPGTPHMTGDEREVADRSIYTNPQKGPGEMELIKYKKGPGESIGEAPSPGGASGGSGQQFFKEKGNYIPQGK